MTVIFDLGGSYEKLTTPPRRQRVADGLWRIATFTINPFCLEPTAEQPALPLLVRARAAPVERTVPAHGVSDDRDLHEAVENLYALDPPQRRLFTLANILPRALGRSTSTAGCRAARTQRCSTTSRTR